MGLIDFILNVAGLLLWLNWRHIYFDPLGRTSPATLAGTLKRAEPRRLKRWQLLAALVLLLFLRALLYWEIGAPTNWVPSLRLGVTTIPFRSDLFQLALLFSLLSFARIWAIFHFWLLTLAIINRSPAEPDPVQKTVRLHLGRIARWPWPAQLLLPVLSVTAFWVALHPALVSLGLTDRVRSTAHLLAQGCLIGMALFFTLKYLLPAILLLYLIVSYVYFGSNPLWDFISATARNLLVPLRRAPLRFAKLDLAPLAGVVLIFLLLHWLPKMLRPHLSFWPQ